MSAVGHRRTSAKVRLWTAAVVDTAGINYGQPHLKSGSSSDAEGNYTAGQKGNFGGSACIWTQGKRRSELR